MFYREVGVFKLRNYLVGVEGLLEINRKIERDLIQRVKVAASERMKMMLAWTLDTLGAADVMVRNRFRPIAGVDLMNANEAIQRIVRTPLPLIES